MQPSPGVFRQYIAGVLAGALALCLTSVPGQVTAAAGVPGQPVSGRAAKAVVKPDHEQFQVAAGTTLPIELRTRLTSSGNRRADVVEGRLLRAVTADDVELIPAGATVMGTVSEAEAAAPKRPGRLVFAFHVIEHPQTGSRATITAAARRFESEPPVKGKIYADVVLEKGADASILLTAPLVVRLPR